eukprot:983505-Amphidinium_carterae.1
MTALIGNSFIFLKNTQTARDHKTNDSAKLLFGLLVSVQDAVHTKLPLVLKGQAAGETDRFNNWP